jgi:hypothetical protein
MQEEEKYVDRFHRDVLNDLRRRGLEILDKKSRIVYINQEPFDWKKFVKELQFMLDTSERMIEYTERYYNEMGDSEFDHYNHTVHELLVRCSGFICLHED